MNLAILNTQQQEQKAIEEMKKYTDQVAPCNS